MRALVLMVALLAGACRGPEPGDPCTGDEETCSACGVGLYCAHGRYYAIAGCEPCSEKDGELVCPPSNDVCIAVDEELCR